VVVEGVLTTGLGSLESGRTGFVQDATAGIAVYLDAPLQAPLAAGTRVRLGGTVGSRYAQRTLRVAGAGITTSGTEALPTAIPVVTGAAGEPVEGARIVLEGTVVEAPSALSDGLGLLVDDGTGPVRVIVAAEALGSLDPGTGDLVHAAGPLGQRDSTGTGLAGYRVYATLPGEMAVEPRQTPTPGPTPTPSPEPTATPAPSVTPEPSTSPAPSTTPAPTTTPTPTALPSPTSSPAPPSTVPVTVADARRAPEGRAVTVRGTVIAEAGRLGTPPLFAIGDGAAGLPVRLADDQVAPARGVLVELRGVIAAPYGQTELRLVTGGLTVFGSGTLPVVLDMEAGRAGEATEGRLARIRGTITAGATKATSGDLAFTIEGTDGASLRILADASANLDPAILHKGAPVRLTGIVGQRASRKGALDGYRLWVRDRADVTISATASPSASASSSPPASSATVPLLSIAAARLREGKRVTVEGTVTADRSLLDTSGRRTIVEDASGAIELYLDAEAPSIRAGVRVRATGTVGRAWGAPRLRAEAIRVLGRRTPVAHDLRVAPGAATEWRLVRVKGTIAMVHRSGDRWTAEVVAGSVRVPLLGLPGSGIASSAVIEGRSATVVGIVRRPYPTATDQRFAVVPRSRGDVDLGAATASGASGPGGSPAASERPTSPGDTAGNGPSTAPGSGGQDVPLASLGDHLGATVRVGGLVTATVPDGVRLDDGTATVRLVLEGSAADLAGLLQPGDAVNATGTPEARDELVLVVTDPAGVVLLGDLSGDGGDDAATASPHAPAMLGIIEGEDGPTIARDPAVSAALAAGRGPDAVSLALATLVLVAGLGAGIGAYRVTRSRRRSRARMQARLDAFASAPAATPATARAPGTAAGPAAPA
jgi:hypothetical protein